MFRSFGLPELIIVLVIILLVFGAGKIKNIAGELGAGIKAFKEGISENEKKEDSNDGKSSKTN